MAGTPSAVVLMRMGAQVAVIPQRGQRGAVHGHLLDWVLGEHAALSVWAGVCAAVPVLHGPGAVGHLPGNGHCRLLCVPALHLQHLLRSQGRLRLLWECPCCAHRRPDSEGLRLASSPIKVFRQDIADQLMAGHSARRASRVGGAEAFDAQPFSTIERRQSVRESMRCSLRWTCFSEQHWTWRAMNAVSGV